MTFVNYFSSCLKYPEMNVGKKTIRPLLLEQQTAERGFCLCSNGEKMDSAQLSLRLLLTTNGFLLIIQLLTLNFDKSDRISPKLWAWEFDAWIDRGM